MPEGHAPSALEIVHLTRTFGDVVAVDDVSLAVGRGEIVGLVGPNGAGKTTLLRCVVGLLRPGSGGVLVAGRDLEAAPAAAKAATGFVPDIPDLFEHLTVADHVEFAARLFGRPDRVAAGLALARELGLDGTLGQVPEELSAGMRQRLALACALAHEPSLLVLDEPLTNVDPRGARLVKDLLRREASRGCGVLLSSHMLALVEEMADRVVVMDRGRVKLDASLSDVRERMAAAAGRGGALEELFLAITAVTEEAG